MDLEGEAGVLGDGLGVDALSPQDAGELAGVVELRDDDQLLGLQLPQELGGQGVEEDGVVPPQLVPLLRQVVIRLSGRALGGAQDMTAMGSLPCSSS